jgi:cell division cycle protein 20 (cofactor of APC complex)
MSRLRTQDTHRCLVYRRDRFVSTADSWHRGQVCADEKHAQDRASDAYQQTLLQTMTGNDGGPWRDSRWLRDAYRRSLALGASRSPLDRHVFFRWKMQIGVQGVVDDYYMKLVDWSSTDLIAVAVRDAVHLYDSRRTLVHQIYMKKSGVEPALDRVSALAWSGASECIALGNVYGSIELWDPVRCTRQRTMQTPGRFVFIYNMTWNHSVLSVGDRGGWIVHHDVRIKDHVVSSWKAHSTGVCGLAWSPDGAFLASGGNDDVVNIWSRGVCFSTQQQPLTRFTQHTAAVKALAWHPTRRGLICSGGGTLDGSIKTWDAQTGSVERSVDTHSQVSSLVWLREKNALLSSHGYPGFSLKAWRPSDLELVEDVHAHRERVLGLSQSPDGRTLASLSADATLVLWDLASSKTRSRVLDVNTIR